MLKKYRRLNYKSWEMGLQISCGVYSKAKDDACVRRAVSKLLGNFSRIGFQQGIERFIR